MTSGLGSASGKAYVPYRFQAICSTHAALVSALYALRSTPRHFRRLARSPRSTAPAETSSFRARCSVGTAFPVPGTRSAPPRETTPGSPAIPASGATCAAASPSGRRFPSRARNAPDPSPARSETNTAWSRLRRSRSLSSRASIWGRRAGVGVSASGAERSVSGVGSCDAGTDTTEDRTPLSRYDVAPLAKRSPLRLVRHLPARLVVDPSVDVQSKGHPGLDDDLLIRWSGGVLIPEQLGSGSPNPHARRASHRDRNTPREPGGRRGRPPNQAHARSDARRHLDRAWGQCFLEGDKAGLQVFPDVDTRCGWTCFGASET